MTGEDGVDVLFLFTKTPLKSHQNLIENNRPIFLQNSAFNIKDNSLLLKREFTFL